VFSCFASNIYEEKHLQGSIVTAQEPTGTKLKKQRAHARCPSADENPMVVTIRSALQNGPTSSLENAELRDILTRSIY
jgi:hypothetical protein